MKNFQIVTESDPSNVVMQFGRVGTDIFTMDFRCVATVNTVECGQMLTLKFEVTSLRMDCNNIFTKVTYDMKMILSIKERLGCKVLKTSKLEYSEFEPSTQSSYHIVIHKCPFPSINVLSKYQ